MAVLRTKCISTKVTAEEYDTLVARAGERTLSEWVREVLLEAATTRTDAVILAELVAFRMIVLNLHYAVSTGQPMTPEIMRQLIEQADRDKFQGARNRLAAAAGRPRA